MAGTSIKKGKKKIGRFNAEGESSGEKKKRQHHPRDQRERKRLFANPTKGPECLHFRGGRGGEKNLFQRRVA